MRILVTGGAGYIGSHATKLFLESGHNVIVYDSLIRGHRKAVPLNCLIVGDLAKTKLIESVCMSQKIDAIVHFAGLTYVGESVENPEIYYQHNVAGTLSLLTAAHQCGIRRIVFSSTAAVYGCPYEVPISEEHRGQPINPYGRTKLMTEQLLADFARAYGIGYAALRYFNAAGAHPDGTIGEDHSPETHLIPIVLQTALGQRPYIDIFGTDYPTPDGTCIRDYVHVNDLAGAHLLALQQVEPGQELTFNLGLGKGYSVRQVVEISRAVTGRPIPERNNAARQGDPPELVAASQKAMNQLGWQPRYTDLDEIIASAWNWHRAHPTGYCVS